MSARVPSSLTAPFLDWRARKIADPVERLRFLRRATKGIGREPKRRSLKGHMIAAVLLVMAGSAAVPFRTVVSAAYAERAPAATPIQLAKPADVAKIWQVETTKEYETYSNGLRIEKQYATSNRPRPKYRVFERTAPSTEKFQWRSDIAGIVYHTTESHMAPFQKEANDRLRVAGRNILAEVQNRRCYNYVIDRFGRVWRVVEESDIAWHAGKSVWADATGVYVNLNDSFIGISFEAQTATDNGQATATAPQIHAARLLTEMLRAKYKIPASNCATHAQVSVSLASMRIGYHTDWAGNFTFEAIGLPDNYAEATPSLWAFGFDYDHIFLRIIGNKPWQGLTVAEQHLREQAALAGIPADRYKVKLQQRFKELIAALYSADEEQANES